MIKISLLVKEYTEQIIKEHGTDIKSAKLDVDILLAHVLQINRSKLILHYDESIDKDLYESFKNIIERRLRHEPIAYLIEKKEFYGRDFFVNKDVLIPRPETEELIDVAMKKLSGSESICDIGTGSGCIAITLKLLMPNLNITAMDISEGAITVAKKNALTLLGKNHGINFMLEDALDYNGNKKFDAIISNPPYIGQDEKHTLMADVIKFEPHIALFSEATGYEFFSTLALCIDSYLKEGGLFFFEIGHNQEENLKHIFCSKEISFMKDMSSKIRFLIGTN